MRPIRVLFVKDRLHDTGGTLYYLQLVTRLDPARVRPMFCALGPWHPIAGPFEAVGVKPLFFGRSRWDPRCLVDLVHWARRCQADLLHLDAWTSFLFGRLGARLVGLPSVLHFHSMLPMPWTRRFLNRQLMSSSWRSIAVSEAVRGWAIQQFAIAPDRIAVLYNGHDIDRFAAPPAGARARIRRELALAADTPVIGVVGRLDIAQKGQDVMIRALPRLRARHADAVVLLVGDGPDRARCEALVHHSGLDGAVHFLGARSDIPDVLAAIDVAVVPSVCDEGLPLVAIEASAAGRPVVASASGGLPEVILHDESGIIVPKGDLDGLVEATARILSDPALAKRLAQGGRRNAARFALSSHVSGLMEVYETALDEHRRRRARPAERLA
jgi:glycosyltransferase involved in cell wall biosynthesis